MLSSQDLDDFMQALPGFLLAFTGEGKLIYVSETVAEHLGHSMVCTGRLVKRGKSYHYYKVREMIALLGIILGFNSRLTFV